jgi:hypothetical protein
MCYDKAMPFIAPNIDEPILAELRELGVIPNELLSSIAADPNEVRLLDKLLEHRNAIPKAGWIAYLCRQPEISFFGSPRPSVSFIASLRLSQTQKETLLNFGVFPLCLENDILWLCGIQASAEIAERAHEIFSAVRFKEIRYCAVPLNLIEELKRITCSYGNY